jgi:hypothetical protein
MRAPRALFAIRSISTCDVGDPRYPDYSTLTGKPKDWRTVTKWERFLTDVFIDAGLVAFFLSRSGSAHAGRMACDCYESW